MQGLSRRTDRLSKWGSDPVSFGIEADVLDQDTVDSLIDSGFVIVGDSLKEVPDEIVSMVRNGGSLEKELPT